MGFVAFSEPGQHGRIELKDVEDGATAGADLLVVGIKVWGGNIGTISR